MSVGRTVALGCAVLGLAALGAVGAVAVAVATAAPERAPAVALLAGGLAGLGLALVAALAWMLLERRLVRPLQALERAAEALAAGSAPAGLAEAAPLGATAAAVTELGETLRRERAEIAQRIGEATRRLEETRRRLEAVLRDLGEAVVVCGRNHEILLYNQAAVRLLGGAGELGLGRPLFRLLRGPPIEHALRRLARARRPGGVIPLACEAVDHGGVLVARMTLVRDPQGRVEGYVISLTDLGATLQSLARHEQRLREAAERLRGPLGSLRAAAETLASHGALEAEARERLLAALVEEAAAASAALDRLHHQLAEPTAETWPLSEIDSAELFEDVIARLGDGSRVVVVGAPLGLRGDAFLLSLLLARLGQRLAARFGRIEIAACALEGQPCIDLVWQGPALSESELEGWLAERLPEAPGGASLSDALDRHRGILWSRAEDGGRAFLRLRLGTGLAAAPAVEPLPPRPEFYDFDLMAHAAVPGPLAERPLARLAYVVFDTETTGLRPSEGDELVAIAGVRVVNRRILSGETFARLINPGRPIPPQAVRIHGIDDAAVRDAPPARLVLPQFKRFCAEDVLVGHNVAFDMKFLALKEAESGVVFDNPVLDTLLLSAFLHGHLENHSLDALAERFGIAIKDRHTALGDAMVTAELFLHLLDLLEARDVRTLGEAIEAQNSMVALRRRQAEF